MNMKRVIIFAVIFASLIIGVVSSLVLSWWERIETFPLWINIFFLILLGSLYLIVFSIKKIFVFSEKMDVFSPYIIFPVSFVLIIAIGSLPSLVDSIEDYQSLFKFYFIGLSSYFVGLLFMEAIFAKKGRAAKLKIEDAWNRKKLRNAIFVIFGLGLLAVILFAIQARLPLFSGEVQEYRFYIRQKVTRVGTLLNLSLSMQVAFIVSFVYLIRNKFEARASKKMIILLLGAFSFLSLFVWASRGRVIIPLLTILLCFHYLKKRIGVKYLVMMFSILFLIFSFAGIQRMRTADSEFSDSIIHRSWQELNIVPRDFLVLKEYFPNKYDFFKGSVFSYPFTTIMPGYQPQPAEVIKQELGLEFAGGGFAFTLIGGFYLDFGVVGIILGMFILGIILNFLYLKMVPHYTEFYVILYSFTCIRALDAIRNSMFLNFSYFWVVFCVILINWYCKKDLHHGSGILSRTPPSKKNA